MRKSFKLYIVLFLFLIILTGCSAMEEKSNLEDKSTAELEYIEKNCIDVLNKFARDEYVSEEDETFKWQEVMEDTNKIEKSSATVLVDLATLNIESSEISKFSDGVNNMILAIESEDISSYLVQLNNIYALVPSYLEKYSKDSDLILKKKLKYYILSTYVAYNQGNRDMAMSQISEAEKIYSEKIKDVDYIKNNEYNANKLYVLIQELKRAVESDSLELVKSKYLLTIEEF